MPSARELQKNREIVGKRIRTLRKERGHSQESFADACGLHRTYIGGVERGEYNIALDNIYKIARALNVTLDELFCR